MKPILTFSTLILCVFIAACDSENPVQPSSYDGKFDLSGAKAITFTLNGGSANARNKEENLSNLFKLEADGKITSIAEDVTVVATYPIKNGLFIMTVDYIANKNRFVIAEMEKPAFELEQWVDNFVGQNDNEDIIFSDGTIFRKRERTFDRIESNLSELRVLDVSGNFAVITDFKIYQVINTVTGTRYNTIGQGVGLWALSDSKVVCDYRILDFATGSSSSSSISYGELVKISQGTAVAYHDPLTTQVTIFEYNMDGVEIKKTDYPGISGMGIKAFFSSDSFYVIQETTRVVIVDRGTGESRVILSGLNVLSTSLGDNILFYLAEDSQGNAITAQLNLVTEMTIQSESNTKYDYIEAILAQ